MAKVSIAINIPTPYRNVFFRSLAEFCDLSVVFDAPIEKNRLWNVGTADFGFDASYAVGATIPYTRRRKDIGLSDERYLHLRSVLPVLMRKRPDVVVSAEFGFRTLQALVYKSLFGKKLIVFSEGTRHSEGWVRGLKAVFRKLVCRLADGFWTSGVDARQLLVDYGAPIQKVTMGMLGIETALFLTLARQASAQRAMLRERLGYRGPTVLFVGQFVDRKGIRELLGALSLVGERIKSPWSVCFVGNGERLEAIQTWAALHPDVTVLTPGFASREEVVQHYCAADLFVLPTLDDNWSVVTLEAAIAGIPQVYSVYNGAATDLSEAGASGALCDPRDVARLADEIEAFVSRGCERVPCDVQDRLASYYSPQAMALRAKESIDASVGTAGAQDYPSKAQVSDV